MQLHRLSSESVYTELGVYGMDLGCSFYLYSPHIWSSELFNINNIKTKVVEQKQQEQKKRQQYNQYFQSGYKLLQLQSFQILLKY